MPTGRLVGNGCRVGPAALRIVGPDIRSRGGIDQLKVHLERFVIALNVTDERVLHAEAGQHVGVGPEIAIGIGRGPGEHPQIAVAAKVSDDVVREVLAKAGSADDAALSLVKGKTATLRFRCGPLTNCGSLCQADCQAAVPRTTTAMKAMTPAATAAPSISRRQNGRGW